MLLAGAHETGLLAALDAAIQPQEALAPLPSHGPRAEAGPRMRLAHTRATTRRMQLQTLLFLGAVGLQRTWDLRSYTGGGLALLSGRPRAYGYRATERFLSELARCGGADALTDALAAWTATVWPPAAGGAPASCYLDGHRKAVYSDVLLPRGLVARRGAVLGGRALLLLHDAAGQPLVVTTQRGDTHLTTGTPALLARYEQHGGPVRRLIIDREGLAAAFLDQLAGEGRQVITVLRTDQYTGLASFTDSGPFVPLQADRHGVLVREVAAARYRLPRPGQPGAPLELSVALVRDHRWRVPDPATGPQATPAAPAVPAGPAPPTMAKLIPIVTTASAAAPVALARTYFHRWPAQENILKDFLLPLGLDTNHGYAKTPVANSENAKKRAALERRLARRPGWAANARARAAQAAQSYARQAHIAQRQAAALYGALYQREAALVARGVPQAARQRLLAAARQAADAAVARPWARAERAWARHRRETAKAQGYGQEQELLHRQGAALIAQERPMYELDNAKDQSMTVGKVALANVAMWVRAQYFPASYAQATWLRLAPFFRLPGRIQWGTQTVQVALCPCNDRALTRALLLLCERVRCACPHLPDGRPLSLTVADAPCPILNAHQDAVA